jgi:hypothetical protein
MISCRATAPVASSFRQAERLPYNSFEVGEKRWLRFLIGERFGALLAAFHHRSRALRILSGSGRQSSTRNTTA